MRLYTNECGNQRVHVKELRVDCNSVFEVQINNPKPIK